MTSDIEKLKSSPDKKLLWIDWELSHLKASSLAFIDRKEQYLLDTGVMMRIEKKFKDFWNEQISGLSSLYQIYLKNYINTKKAPDSNIV